MAALGSSDQRSRQGMPKQSKDGPASVRLPMVVTEKFARELDDWRRDQPDVPNRSEAIRRMAEAAFAQRRREKGIKDA